MRPVYFIFAPAWTYCSSGVRVLHLLCHALNEAGEKAYIVPTETAYVRNPHLNTPLFLEVTNSVKAFAESGQDFIAVYPDIVAGNPLGAKKVVRYLLAPRGLYGGDAVFPDTDKVYGYTKDLADKVLFLPPYDTNVFYAPPDGSPRKGEVFYAHKYDKLHGHKLCKHTENATRLEGTPQEIAEMLRKAEVCWMYERSELGILARFCGCKVYNIITEGYWDGVDPLEAVDEDGELVLDYAKDVDAQLAAFIKGTQEWQ